MLPGPVDQRRPGDSATELSKDMSSIELAFDVEDVSVQFPRVVLMASLKLMESTL